MPYLDATVKEILRYHPPIQIISRTCSREINVCGYKIPPKANVRNFLTYIEITFHRFNPGSLKFSFNYSHALTP